MNPWFTIGIAHVAPPRAMGATLSSSAGNARPRPSLAPSSVSAFSWVAMLSLAATLGCSGSAYSKSRTVAGGVAPDSAEAGYAPDSAAPGDRASTPSKSMAIRPSRAAAGVRAGEWDDNANYREFQKLLSAPWVSGARIQAVDIRDRHFIILRDSQGKAVPSCRIAVRVGERVVARLTTLSNGRAILFPRAAGIAQPEVELQATCGQQSVRSQAILREGEGVIELTLPGARSVPARPRLDIAFVLDTTGSMSEEISSVKETIRAVARELDALGADIRVGLVEFKDRTDALVTRVYPLSSDLVAFSSTVAGISARGGGDTPESVNEGLSVAISQLAWDSRATARIAFLVGDAPPHLDYTNDVDYVTSMRHAARRGIQLHTIAASGMDRSGQLIWRQIAQFTGGTNLFVLRGGAGPQSTGAGDPLASCGGTQKSYTSGNLAALVLGKIRAALTALEADPRVIAGLGQDERAKPCSERVIATE